MKPKAPEVPPPDQKSLDKIKRLFKAGLEDALKDPEKFWDAENKKAASTPYYDAKTRKMVSPKAQPTKESLSAMADDLRRVLRDDT